MKLKRVLSVSALSLGLLGGFSIPLQNQSTQTVQAASRGFSTNWRGTWYGNPTNLKISKHSMKFNYTTGKVSYITKATYGYYHVHFSNQHDVYMKRSNAGGKHILLRLTPNSAPISFYK